MNSVQLSVLAFVGMLTACTSEGSGSSDTGQSDGSNLGGGSMWKVEDTVDPMTDARLLTASREFDQPPYKVEVIVTCNVPSGLNYQFSTFDADGKGADLQKVPTNGALLTPYIVRLDKEKRQSSFEMSGRYSNSLVIRGWLLGQDPKAMARASRVLVRLSLTSGDVTITLDQTDKGLRSVLDKCVPPVRDQEKLREQTQGSSDAESGPQEAPQVGSGGSCSVEYKDDDGYYRPQDGRVYFKNPQGVCTPAPTGDDLDQVAEDLRKQGLEVTEHPPEQ